MMSPTHRNSLIAATDDSWLRQSYERQFQRRVLSCWRALISRPTPMESALQSSRAPRHPLPVAGERLRRKKYAADGRPTRRQAASCSRFGVRRGPSRGFYSVDSFGKDMKNGRFLVFVALTWNMTCSCSNFRSASPIVRQSNTRRFAVLKCQVCTRAVDAVTFAAAATGTSASSAEQQTSNELSHCVGKTGENWRQVAVAYMARGAQAEKWVLAETHGVVTF